METVRKRTAFITGASSGIGAAFAERLAGQGLDLVITGRRREKLETVAAEIVTRHGVDVQVVIAELADETQLAMVAGRVAALPGLEVLVNNAGFGQEGGGFHEQDIAAHEAMLKVHTMATVRLTHAALPAMIANHRGSIINVSSVAGFVPLPNHTMYSATKAFVAVFSESLAMELRGTGVRVQALCPGWTRTDFHTRQGIDPAKVYRERGPLKAMTPRAVVDASLRCLARDEVLCVPGFNNRFLSTIPRFLPRRLLHRLLASVRDF